MLAEGSNLALPVLHAMDIETSAVKAELDRAAVGSRARTLQAFSRHRTRTLDVIPLETLTYPTAPIPSISGCRIPSRQIFSYHV